MSDAARVLELVIETLDSGRTPEEVCAAVPELLPEVRRRWQECHRIAADVGELFPASGNRVGGGGRPWEALEALPQIPGYEVAGILGRGGMGVVYRARHLGLDRNVALKMLLSGAYASGPERARFLREAQAVAALRHANVVQVHDVGEFDGRPYFTMELVAGGSLGGATFRRTAAGGEGGGPHGGAGRRRRGCPPRGDHSPGPQAR